MDDVLEVDYEGCLFLVDKEKRGKVLRERKIDLLKCPPIVFDGVTDSRLKAFPNQLRAIGIYSGTRLVTVVYEDMKDEESRYTWIITAWEATREEKARYLKGTGGG